MTNPLVQQIFTNGSSNASHSSRLWRPLESQRLQGSGYRKTSPKKSFPPGAKSSKPQVAMPLTSLPSEAEYTEGEILLSPSHHSGLLRCSIYLKTSCPQTPQGSECHPGVLYPACLGLHPPISTQDFSQGPTTSGFESARLSEATPSDLPAAKNNRAH